MTVRLRRSMMFTPGTAGDRIAKAIERGEADMVVADLEDAVPPDAKAAARETVRDALRERTDAARPERCVRVNAWSSGRVAEDLAVVMAARPHAVVLPKAERAAHVEAMDALLLREERRVGVAPGSTALILLIETAAGVLTSERLAHASPRVSALAFGAEDLAADAGLRRTREGTEILYARSHVALAAASARIDAIDQVFVDLDDLEGLAREARMARSLGYGGKMVLHPRQIAPVHDAFTPSAAEVEAAHRLVAAADAKGAGEGGVLLFEGRMVDVPLIGQARRVLAQAEAAGARRV